MSVELAPILLTAAVIVIVLIGVALASRGGGRRNGAGPYSSSTEWKASSTYFGPGESEEQPKAPVRDGDDDETAGNDKRED